MAMNAHGDLSFEEWKASKLSFTPSTHSKKHFGGVHFAPMIRGIEADDTVDWRAKGAVTPVKVCQ